MERAQFSSKGNRTLKGREKHRMAETKCRMANLFHSPNGNKCGRGKIQKQMESSC